MSDLYFEVGKTYKTVSGKNRTLLDPSAIHALSEDESRLIKNTKTPENTYFVSFGPSIPTPELPGMDSIRILYYYNKEGEHLMYDTLYDITESERVVAAEENLVREVDVL